jgi:glycine betaine/choline ABC-type transport system substrate-binding protein
MTLKVIQELDARVELEKETPKQVATEYLEEEGFTG